MYKVVQQFHDAKSLQLVTVGSIIDWDDKERIQSALERGLIEEIKEAKTEKKAEPKKKAPAKKETRK